MPFNHFYRTLKDNYGYFKKGVKEKAKNYQRLQKIKNTPEVYRSTLDQEWADAMNKTKKSKKSNY